jgi:hypothetical protein
MLQTDFFKRFNNVLGFKNDYKSKKSSKSNPRPNDKRGNKSRTIKKKQRTSTNTTKTAKTNNTSKQQETYKQLRIPEGFSEDVKKSINLIKFNQNLNLKPVGSFKYRIHSYPSDIDLFEKYEDCCDLEQTSAKLAAKFKKIAALLKKQDTIFLGEVKLGFDMDTFVDYGELDYKKKEIKGYNYENLKDYLVKMQNNKYIDQSTYKKLNTLINPRPSMREFYIIHEEFRKLFILRWNINELSTGYKTIRGKKITLEECFQHQTITKIDIWAPINNNYTEITNFYYILFKNKKGQTTYLCKELKNYKLALDNDIGQYASIEFRNSLKVAKKLWIRGNLINNNKILKKLYPLFNSNCSKLNQIKEELKVVNDILTRYIDNTDNNLNRNFTYKVLPIIKGQIEGLKGRINDIFDINIDYKKAFNLLNKNTTLLGSLLSLAKPKTKKNISNTSLNKVIDNNTQLIKLFEIYIEEYAYNYLTRNQIYRMKKSKPGKSKKSYSSYTDMEVFTN